MDRYVDTRVWDRSDLLVGTWGMWNRADPPPPGACSYGQDCRKVSTRIVQLYVIVMTDAAHAGSHALIVIRADHNLDSRDRADIGIAAMIQCALPEERL